MPSGGRVAAAATRSPDQYKSSVTRPMVGGGECRPPTIPLRATSNQRRGNSPPFRDSPFPLSREHPPSPYPPRPPTSIVDMALSKLLMVTALLAMLALPMASAALPVDREAVSAVADAPGLSALVRATEACSYFQCGSPTVEVVAKHTYPCWFKVATGNKGLAPDTCSPTPYDCVDDATCKGWKQCKCDVCKTVKLTKKEYCKLPEE
nr:NyHTR2L protein [Neopyropia yezoensis]